MEFCFMGNFFLFFVSILEPESKASWGTQIAHESSGFHLYRLVSKVPQDNALFLKLHTNPATPLRPFQSDPKVPVNQLE